MDPVTKAPPSGYNKSAVRNESMIHIGFGYSIKIKQCGLNEIYMFIPNVTTDILQFLLKYMFNDKFYISTGLQNELMRDRCLNISDYKSQHS